MRPSKAFYPQPRRTKGCEVLSKGKAAGLLASASRPSPAGNGMPSSMESGPSVTDGLLGTRHMSDELLARMRVIRTRCGQGRLRRRSDSGDRPCSVRRCSEGRGERGMQVSSRARSPADGGGGARTGRSCKRFSPAVWGAGLKREEWISKSCTESSLPSLSGCVLQPRCRLGC